MNSRRILSLLVVCMVALAGCSGGPGTGTTAKPTSTDTATPGGNTGGNMDAGSGSGASSATVNFYVSDKPGALDDFQSLNVTITRVGFKRANTTAATNDSMASNTATTAGNSTTTAANTTTATEADGDNETASQSSSGWVETEINATTVDLTELVGDNATKLGSLSVPNGTYSGVYAYVSSVNGTLTDGTRQRVKLPSGKLKLNSQFSVGTNESVDFVFDIQVHEAGKSGKYILRPVISQSGTNQQIHEVGANPGTHSMDGNATTRKRKTKTNGKSASGDAKPNTNTKRTRSEQRGAETETETRTGAKTAVK